jgi:phosphoglycolate phosphatase
MDTAPKLCVFDYDDTLVMTRQAKFRAIRELGSRFYQKEIEDETISFVWGKPYREFFSELFDGIDRDIDRVISRYQSLDLEFPIGPYEDSLSAITEISLGAEVGIVSSCSRKVIIDQMAQFGFSETLFSFIYGEEDTEFHKPNPKVFNKVFSLLESQQINYSECLYCGDSEKDMLAAIAAGFMFVGIDRDKAETERMRSAGVTVVRNLRELKDLITN